MNMKALLTDDEAVSPVIGVILMVAITVILAAVIGTFVLGLGNQVGNNAPQASFTTDFVNNPATANEERVEFAHNGGASVLAGRLSFTGSDIAAAPADSGTTSVTWVDASTASGITAQSQVTAGSTAEIYSGSSDQDLDDHTIRLIWTSEGGDSSAELAKWTGPDAN